MRDDDLQDHGSERDTLAAGPARLGLPAFLRAGEPIDLAEIPAGAESVLASNARGVTIRTAAHREAAALALAPGTWQLEALDAAGGVLAAELVTVGSHPAERPVHAFVTSFESGSAGASLEWLNSLRATVVQFYDWMAAYCAPVGPGPQWRDPSQRLVVRATVEELAREVRSRGGVALAYAPVYAADLDYAAAHPEQMLYRGDGQRERLFDAIVLANPADVRWQEQFLAAYGNAADELGFNGVHVDTYGFPRAALDARGAPVGMRSAYEGFLGALRAGRPEDTISFNQVNGVPPAVRLPRGPSIRYCEAWPPNGAWRHLEALVDRTSGRSGGVGGQAGPADDRPVRGSLACYPPVWGRPGDALPAERRLAALRTVVSTEAIATMLGVSILVHGDQRAVLDDPYYPQHERLTAREASIVLDWHRFALRCRDLFLDGEDTSWYEIGDDNGAVSVTWDGPVHPEPMGGSVFARVVSTDDYVAVGALDLSGSAAGRWSETTASGECRGVRVRILRDRPERWEAAGAVLGHRGGQFVPLGARTVEHREGLALEVELPVVSGWSILRLVPRRG